MYLEILPSCGCKTCLNRSCLMLRNPVKGRTHDAMALSWPHPPPPPHTPTALGDGDKMESCISPSNYLPKTHPCPDFWWTVSVVYNTRFPQLIAVISLGWIGCDGMARPTKSIIFQDCRSNTQSCSKRKTIIISCWSSSRWRDSEGKDGEFNRYPFNILQVLEVWNEEILGIIYYTSESSGIFPCHFITNSYPWREMITAKGGRCGKTKTAESGWELPSLGR